MRILIYGINYAPDLIGVAKYTTEMSQFLVETGHEVRVIAGPPYYPAWEIPKQYRSFFYRNEQRGSIRVTRCPMYVPPSQGTVARLLHHVSFAITSAPAIVAAALRFRPDIVLAIAPSLSCAPAAIAAARLSGAALWLHVQDFEVDAAFDMGFMSGGRFKRMALWLESALLKRFDRVSTLSSRMADSLEQKGVLPSRILEFPNWVDTQTIVPLDRRTTLRSMLNAPDNALIALYSGNMGKKQGLDYLAAVARNLVEQQRRNDVLFAFCGSGPAKDELRAATDGLSNVRFLDLQPPERLCELLSTADIHLLPQRPEMLDLVLPAKLTGMLASGRPIIAMAEPQTQLHAELVDSGIVVPPGDVEAFASAIVQVADNSDLRRRLGTRGRDAACSRWDRGVILTEAELRMQELREYRTAVRSRRKREQFLGKAYGGNVYEAVQKSEAVQKRA